MKFCEMNNCEAPASHMAATFIPEKKISLCEVCYHAYQIGQHFGETHPITKPRVIIDVIGGVAHLRSGGRKVNVIIKDHDKP